MSPISKFIQANSKIKIIGDSIAAGAGSSNEVLLELPIITVDSKTYFYRNAPNSWWGLLSEYLHTNYPSCKITNNGCGGFYSNDLVNNIGALVCDEDDVVIVLIGTNDRKIYNGMNVLSNNLSMIITYLKEKKKSIILMTPNPSTKENESFPNRLYTLEEVCNVIRAVALKENFILVDCYHFIEEELRKHNFCIEQVIIGEGCYNDGLHPSDKVQQMMFQNFINVVFD